MKLLCFLILSLALSVQSIENQKAIDIIHLASVNWPPYFGDDLVKQGFFTELSRAYFADSKYNLKVTFMPWSRALKGAMLGKFEGLLGAYKLPERVEKMYYSNPVFIAKETFYQLKRKPVITYTKLEDLKDYRFGVVNSHLNSIEFKKADYLNKIPGSSLRNAINRLLHDKVDIIVAGRLVILDVAKKEFPDRVNELLAIEPPLKNQALYITLHKDRKNAKKIINKFNRSMQQLSRSGKAQEIMKEFGFDVF